ncbi:hypothetical protein WJX74_009940 [Apatococcus lobatus]|uniref:TFA2 Winged helix domain-containing protein n=1 Tax=Apatococcus lobatus TaxID=904363 RepID=A0AAW1Q6A7_9CHLO
MRQIARDVPLSEAPGCGSATVFARLLCLLIGMSQVEKVREQFRKRQLDQKSVAGEAARAKKPKTESKRGGRGRGRGRGSKAAEAAQEAAADPSSTDATGGASLRATLKSATTVRPSLQAAQQQRQAAQSAALGAAPIGKLLKDVLDLLKEKRPEPVSKAQIKSAKGIDVSDLPELQEQLQQHSNIEQTPSGGYVFKALHQLDGKDDLLRLVRRSPGGLLAEDLPESYEGVLTDLQALKESGEIWLIRSGGGDIAYPRDNSCQIPMDDEICKLWHEIKLPSETHEMVAALEAAKLIPTPRAMPRQREQKAAKEKKKRAPRFGAKITNAHLPELFVGEAPVQIDTK